MIRGECVATMNCEPLPTKSWIMPPRLSGRAASGWSPCSRGDSKIAEPATRASAPAADRPRAGARLPKRDPKRNGCKPTRPLSRACGTIIRDARRIPAHDGRVRLTGCIRAVHPLGARRACFRPAGPRLKQPSVSWRDRPLPVLYGVTCRRSVVRVHVRPLDFSAVARQP